MINYLIGYTRVITPDNVIVEVNGIGYSVTIAKPQDFTLDQLVKVFTYITLRVGSRENTVSSFLVDTVNSELKSSSIITAFLSIAHLIYSFRLEALAVTPLGKLLKGVM